MGDGVSHDAFSEPTGSQSGTFSWTHTPVGAPSGVLVFLMRIDASSATISDVTYGGVSLNSVQIAQDSSGEPGLCKAYFKGSGLPTGPQTVQVITTSGTYYAGAITVTAVGNTDVATNKPILEGDGTLAEQNVDDGSPGSPSLRYAGGFSGLGSPPTVGANSTSLQSIDDGLVCVVICRETTAGGGARPVGFSSATTDDRAFVFLAVKEL